MIKYFFTFFSISFFAFSSLARDYSVNLMWLFKEKSQEHELLFPEKHEETRLKDAILGWAEKNPQAQITVWYDSEFVTLGQIENSRLIFNNWNEQLSRNERYKIVLQDVREIPGVNKNAIVFSARTPTYFHADMFRIMATLFTLEKCETQCYFVYADMDVKPMSEDVLFDDETSEKLIKFGMVLKEGGPNHDMENSFHIVSNQKENLTYAIKTALIDLNIARAEAVLADTYRTYTSPKTKALQQVVYDSFPLMFMLFYHLEGLGKLEIKTPGEGWTYRNYDRNMDDFSVFNPQRTPHDISNVSYSFTAQDKSIKPLNAWDAMKIPTKAVEAPKAKGKDYY